jgi:hypothetical protein
MKCAKCLSACAQIRCQSELRKKTKNLSHFGNDAIIACKPVFDAIIYMKNRAPKPTVQHQLGTNGARLSLGTKS